MDSLQHPVAYLRAATLNAAVTRHRLDQRWRRRDGWLDKDREEHPLEIVAPCDPERQAIVREELAEAIDTIGPAVVRLIVEASAEGCIPVAQRLGIRPGNLRVLIHCARAVLRGSDDPRDRWRLHTFQAIAKRAA